MSPEERAERLITDHDITQVVGSKHENPGEAVRLIAETIREAVAESERCRDGAVADTDRVRKVLALARAIAAEWGHASVGTEHLLAAIAREGNGVACNVLKEIGADPAMVEGTTRKLLGSGT